MCNSSTDAGNEILILSWIKEEEAGRGMEEDDSRGKTEDLRVKLEGGS